MTLIGTFHACQPRTGTWSLVTKTYRPWFPSMPHAHQIHKQPHRAGNTRGQLAKERIARIDVDAFPVTRHEHTAFERRFARIVGSQQRFELWVPLRHEIETAFLDPAVKIFRRDLVG